MKLSTVLFVISVFLQHHLALASNLHGINRPHCVNRNAAQKYSDEQSNDMKDRLTQLRKEMQIRSSMQGPEIDAYIVSSYDEHQLDQMDASDERRKFISGFTGRVGDAVITLKTVALWTDARYIDQADKELDCEWKIFRAEESPTMAEWLATQVQPESIVGADPKLIPHYLWLEWERQMRGEFLRLVKVHKNIIDTVWGESRPEPRDFTVKVQPLIYAGEKWENKVEALRESLDAIKCDAMVVTSLTEIAYLLNIRGTDIPYTPVFKSYLIITKREIILYLHQAKLTMGTKLHLKSYQCYHEKCIQTKHYHDFWRDLRTLAQQWRRVLVPSHSVFDMGASEAVYSALPQSMIVERVSPIIYMRAQKNPTERAGMQKAHIRDAAAFCEAMSYFEDRYLAGDRWTESLLTLEVDRARREQDLNAGLSFKTVVAYGKHGALSHYYPTNETNLEINSDNLLLIDSGGQYYDGTTDIARTIHMGEATSEQKKAYTNVLLGIIRLSMLVFPENLKPAEADTLIRGPLWSTMHDYPHLTGYGIGSYMSVHESPINIAYTAKHKYTFKEGYFFSIAPGYYKNNEYGIRLKNVLEVVDTGETHPSGNNKFLKFQDVTLVPFDHEMIDKSLMSVQEKKWLNEYNARIRDLVGEELKKQMNMPAFHWMMKKTRHVLEFLPESEYINSPAPALKINITLAMLMSCFIFIFTHSIQY